MQASERHLAGRLTTTRLKVGGIRRQPGVFASLRSFALNILRANGVSNVSEALLYTNVLSLDRLLAYGLPKQN